ncbi:hypothetical protein GLOTRDRAFT_97337, partial [Gloeophyllum trabeum ATCC 11539]
SEKFKNYYRQMESSITRIVLDEAHQLITDSNFRSNFLRLSELAAYPVQKIHLSATIPAYMEKRYLEIAALPNSTPILRAPTYRANLSYSLFAVNPRVRSQARLIVDVAAYMQANYWDDKCRGIIFCPSVERAKELGRHFNNCISHSDKTSLSDMQRFLNEEAWFKGTMPWIVATTTLIHGIDCPRVKVVMYDNILFGLTPKTQADGLLQAETVSPGEKMASSSACATPAVNPQQDVFSAPASGSTDDLYGSLDDQAFMDIDMEPASLVPGQAFMVQNPSISGSPAAVVPSGTVTSSSGSPMRIQAMRNAHQRGSSFGATRGSLVASAPPTPTPLRSTPGILGSSTPVVHSGSAMRLQAIRDAQQLGHPGTPLQLGRILVPSTPVTSSHPSGSARPTPSGSIARQERTPYGTPPHFGRVLVPSTPVTASHPSGSARPAASMSIVMDAAYAEQLFAEKRRKAALLGVLTGRLLTRCPICWAYSRNLVVDGPSHRRFRDCCGPKGSSDHANGWSDLRAEMAKIGFAKYQYCYTCGMPQTKNFKPECHTQFLAGEKNKCPMAYFTVHLLWFIYCDLRLMEKARRVFPDIPRDFSVESFAKWVMKGESPDRFYNGLELILWWAGSLQLAYEKLIHRTRQGPPFTFYGL